VTDQLDRQQEHLSTTIASKPNDGEQVEPVPAEPENVHVREAPKSNGELARE
jgi:hypothetical protein